MTQEELNVLANEFYDYLANQKDFYEVWPSEDDTICVDVDWGDWRQDHLRLDHVAREFFNEKGYDVLNMDTQVTDEDGSDTYSATHSYRLRKHVEESKVEEDLEDRVYYGTSGKFLRKYGLDKYFYFDGCDLVDKEDDSTTIINFGRNGRSEEAILKEIKEYYPKIFKKLGLSKYLKKDESLKEDDKIEEESNGKGEKIAQLIARAYKGRVGPFGGEDPYLDGNKVTFHSQGPDESWIFNDDGSVDSGDDVDYLVAHSDPSDYGYEDEDELRDYFEEIRHFDSIEDLFNSGLSWFMEVPNEKELLRKINNILQESLKEEVESKVRLENPKLVSWAEYYLNDVCDGDEDQYNELYADSVENDFDDVPCQLFFDVLDDKNNYLGKIGIYLFDGMGMWYEIGFEPNAEYLDIEKLDLEDMDLPIDGWFPEEHMVKNDDDFVKTEEQAREYLKPYLAKIENAIEYSNDDLED